MRVAFAAAIFIGSLAAPAIAQQFDLPAGWRYPSTKELSNEIRNNSQVRYATAVADFNGDGIEDTALLLKSTTSNAEALWVRLSDKNAKFNWMKLHEIQWKSKSADMDLAMGIDVLPPGTHPYACFDEAKQCNFGPLEGRFKLKLSDPSLVYFKLEGAASLFFWGKQQKHQKFWRVWLTE